MARLMNEEIKPLIEKFISKEVTSLENKIKDINASYNRGLTKKPPFMESSSLASTTHCIYTMLNNIHKVNTKSNTFLVSFYFFLRNLLTYLFCYNLYNI